MPGQTSYGAMFPSLAPPRHNDKRHCRKPFLRRAVWKPPKRQRLKKPAGSGVGVSVLLRQPHGFEGFIGCSHKEAPAEFPLAGASGSPKPGFRSAWALALHETDALALVLEL